MRIGLFSPLVAGLAFACGAAVDPTTGGDAGGSASTSDPSPGATGSTVDTSGSPASTDSTADPLSSSSTTLGSDASSSFSGETPVYDCPPNPYSDCTVSPDCEVYGCGDPNTTFLDADGCLRPRCDADFQCPTGMRCYSPLFCAGGCVEPEAECFMNQSNGECQCSGVPVCGAEFCVPEAEWPGCCLLDSDDPDSCPPPGE